MTREVRECLVQIIDDKCRIARPSFYTTNIQLQYFQEQLYVDDPASIGRRTFSFIVGPVSRSKVRHKLRTVVIFMWISYSVKFYDNATTCARSLDSWKEYRVSLKRRTTLRVEFVQTRCRPCVLRRTSLDARCLIKDFFSWLSTEWETGARVTEWQNRMTSEIGICMMDVTLDGWLIDKNTQSNA